MSHYLPRAIAFCLLIGSGVFPAHADFACDEKVDKANEQKLKIAEQKNAAGDIKEAYTLVRIIPDQFCAQSTTKRRAALYQSSTKALGEQEERKKNYRAAYSYYKEGKWTNDAKRTLMLHTKSNARHYQEMDFARGELYHLADDQLSAEFAAIVKSRLSQLEQEEEKAFASNQNTLNLLEDINQWHTLISNEEYANTKRTAIKRGDTLRKNPATAIKERAMSYYQLSGDESKIKALRSEASSLAQIEEKKGNRPTAARLYSLAENHEKADALSIPAESDDTSRKTKFAKEQEELEKELGF